MTFRYRPNLVAYWIPAFAGMTEGESRPGGRSHSAAGGLPHRPDGALVARARAAARRDQAMHEGELDDDGRRQRERIEVGQAHAAVDRVDRESQRQPGIDDAIQL